MGETVNNRLRRLLRSRLQRSADSGVETLHAPPLRPTLTLAVLAKNRESLASRDESNAVREFRDVLEYKYEEVRRLREHVVEMSYGDLPSYHEEPEVPALLRRQI